MEHTYSGQEKYLPTLLSVGLIYVILSCRLLVGELVNYWLSTRVLRYQRDDVIVGVQL